MTNNPLQTPQDPFRLPEPVELNAEQAQQPEATQSMSPSSLQPLATSSPLGSSSPAQYDESQINAVFTQRAQQLQAQHVQDPFVYSRELSALKAEFMMQRYGREVKTQSRD